MGWLAKNGYVDYSREEIQGDWQSNGKGAFAMIETEYPGMTKDEMQRFIDQQMRDGRSWTEALERLAEVIGIKPSTACK